MVVARPLHQNGDVDVLELQWKVRRCRDPQKTPDGVLHQRGCVVQSIEPRRHVAVRVAAKRMRKQTYGRVGDGEVIVHGVRDKAHR